MRFPKIIAAQRLQIWLLVATLLSLALIALLVVDLAKNVRSVVIAETRKTLLNAIQELGPGGTASSRSLPANAGWDAIDQDLKKVSYEVLRSYPDVEGGYLAGHDVIGHSFPTYTEPGSVLRQPPLEHELVLDALNESRRTRTTATRMLGDNNDLVMVAVLAGPEGHVSAWCLRRILNFSSAGEFSKRAVLVGVMAVALLSIGIVLVLSFSMQRGFAVIQAGLQQLQTDTSYRVPDQNHELSAIVQSVNAMAEARERLEADLRREDRLRVMGRVVAGIAHEIRNPLNSIRLMIRVLTRRTEKESPAQETLGLITGEIDRLDALLKSLLFFHADEAPKSKVQFLAPIVERTVALVKPHAQERGVEISVRATETCQAFVDGYYLQQALMNLLLNAIDASAGNGKVRVSLETVGGQVGIAIQDSGPGISHEQRDQIFEAFYTTKPGGTGLGLAVTKTLIERMGATITADNGATGALFRVTLPIGANR